MSAGKTIIINCGATHVSGAVASVRNHQLTLESIVAEPLEYDFAAEGRWLGALSAALKRVHQRRGFQGPATYFAPGYQLLTKTLKVPSVDKSKQAQAIAFEAANNIPYPLAEVVWDYQIVADDGVEVEVLLIFVKRESIDTFCAAITSSGGRPAGISGASILDYNAYRLAFPGEQPDTLLINVGARSTNLLFISGDSFKVRNIALGGNNLTQSIADNLGRSFAKAEHLKNHAFADGSLEAADSATFSAIEGLVSSFLKKLGTDITRSVVNYRRQGSGSAPTRLLLCGRGSLLAGLGQHLQETQKMPVETFDPLSGVELGADVDLVGLGAYRHSLSEIVGEAARLVQPDPVAIELLPQQLASAMTFRRQKPFYAIAAAILALAVVPPYLHFSKAKEAAALANEGLEGAVAPIEQLHATILEEQAKAEYVAGKIDSLDRLVRSRTNWVEFLAQLQESLQDVGHVWLESFDFIEGSDGRIRITGQVLLHEFDQGARVQQLHEQGYERIKTLMERFTQSRFIEAIVDDEFPPDRKRDRILGFEFTLVTDPQRPL